MDLHEPSDAGECSPAPIATGVGPLRGRALRLVLLDELRRRGDRSVLELVAVLTSSGLALDGRESKTISDALRWEVRAGRVVRVRRGVYRFSGAHRSRQRRASLLAEACRRWATAPPSVVAPDSGRQQARPPWEDLGWLWNR